MWRRTNIWLRIFLKLFWQRRFSSRSKGSYAWANVMKLFFRVIELIFYRLTPYWENIVIATTEITMTLKILNVPCGQFLFSPEWRSSFLNPLVAFMVIGVGICNPSIINLTHASSMMLEILKNSWEYNQPQSCFALAWLSFCHSFCICHDILQFC